MGAERPSYMLAPNWDLPPDGDVWLGSIIKDPKCPDRSLNSESRVDPDSVTKTTKPDWSLTQLDLLSLDGGFAASFLAPLVGFGGGVTGKAFRDESTKLKCQKLETQYFSPSDSYIANSLCGTAVKAYTKKYYWKSVYMITGLKIAHGASIETGRKANSGADVAVQVNATPLVTVPVEGEPHVGFERSREHAVAFGLCNEPFIIGYRLLKITPRFNGNFRDKPFNKFALLSDQNSDSASKRQWNCCIRLMISVASKSRMGIDRGETAEVWCLPGLFDGGTN